MSNQFINITNKANGNINETLLSYTNCEVNLQTLTYKAFQIIIMEVGNNWATKPTKTSETTTQIREDMKVCKECVCPYHKLKRR